MTKMPAHLSPNSSRATCPPRDSRTTNTVTHMVTATHNHAPCVSLTPAGLVEVRHLLLVHVRPGFLYGGGEHGRGSPLQLADRSHTHGDTEDIVHHLLGRALGQAIGPCAQRDRGLDARTVGATGHPGGPGGSRDLATGGTYQLMPLIFGHDRLDRAEARSLDAATARDRPPLRARGNGGHCSGFKHHHLIDFFHREQGARTSQDGPVDRRDGAYSESEVAVDAGVGRWKGDVKNCVKSG